MRSLHVDGVAVVVGGGIDSLWSVVESTGSGVRAIDEAQFDQGVGPVVDALSRGGVHSATDLEGPGPYGTFLAHSANSASIRAVFAIGISLPTENPAALQLSRFAPGQLEDETLVSQYARTVALAIADDIERTLRDRTSARHWIERFVPTENT
ncbi:hypothetical protein [Williamsia serinedens]|uniref:hypothetical protein n=1 Tax=Williamsia serinedens TaxID=391736 RepID=UPI0020A5E2AB|nr:hypothetical protein [Williamsia serinedens]